MTVYFQALLIEVVTEHAESSATEEKIDLFERLLLGFFEPEENGGDGDADVCLVSFESCGRRRESARMCVEGREKRHRTY